MAWFPWRQVATRVNERAGHFMFNEIKNKTQRTIYKYKHVEI